MKIYITIVGANEITVRLNSGEPVTKTAKPKLTAVNFNQLLFECDDISETVENYGDIFINGSPLKGSFITEEMYLSVAVFDSLMGKVFTSGGGGGGVESVTAASGQIGTVNNADPLNPVISSGIMVSSVTLNNDAILGLPSNPVEVIPAQGVGKIVQLLFAFLYAGDTFGGYGNVTASRTWQFYYSNFNVEASGVVDCGGAFILPNSVVIVPPKYVLSGDASFPAYIAASYYGQSGSSGANNRAVFLTSENSGDYTGGDPGATLKVISYFIVVDITL